MAAGIQITGKSRLDSMEQMAVTVVPPAKPHARGSYR